MSSAAPLSPFASFCKKASLVLSQPFSSSICSLSAGARQPSLCLSTAFLPRTRALLLAPIFSSRPSRERSRPSYSDCSQKSTSLINTLRGTATFCAHSYSFRISALCLSFTSQETRTRSILSRKKRRKQRSEDNRETRRHQLI